jgi:hypothetical protein
VRTQLAAGGDEAETEVFEQVRAGVRARGCLPLGGPGDAAFEGQWNRTRAIAEHVVAYDALPGRRMPVFRVLEGAQVFGLEHEVRGETLLYVTPYSLHSHAILAVWTRLVGLAAAAPADAPPVTEARLVGWSSDAPVGVVEMRLRAPQRDEAIAVLGHLVALMHAAHVQALPFTADAARALCEGRDLAKLWSGEDERYPPSDDVRLVRQVLGEECPFLGPDGEPLETFRALVTHTWVPLSAHTDEDAE